MKSLKEIEENMYEFAKLLWPFDRSITGEGVRNTLKEVKKIIPSMKIKGFKTGTKSFDWEIPKEWKVNSAYIIDPKGQKICDFSENNLHLVGYSEAFFGKLTLTQLQEFLHSLPNQPDAIPYVTSYYKKRWGFCISETQRKNLIDGIYEVIIDAEFKKGFMNYGEIYISGATKKEVFLSTYICHPSMANNEISGIVVATYIAKYLLQRHDLKYSYRIVFLPETIGSISYLSRNYRKLKRRVIAGFNVTCVGDNRSYSYLPSRDGNTLSDRVAINVLKQVDPSFKTYTWLERGSDERQYCAPGIDLPIASIMRTKYGEYPEYHTSLDRLGTVVTSSGLRGGYQATLLALESIEKNVIPVAKFKCEPQLSRRNMYPDLSIKNSYNEVKILMNALSYVDGRNSTLDIAEKCKKSVTEIYDVLNLLRQKNLLKFK